MKALVLERKDELSLRSIDVEEALRPRDVRIALKRVGVCGSDVHYYVHGGIGPFIVEEPMVLGHEASGEVVEVGSAVTSLAVGDRVCMEPGIPDPNSRPTRLGKYNLDPAVRFWATPPVHGVLRPTVVHTPPTSRSSSPTTCPTGRERWSNRSRPGSTPPPRRRYSRARSRSSSARARLGW